VSTTTTTTQGLSPSQNRIQLSAATLNTHLHSSAKLYIGSNGVHDQACQEQEEAQQKRSVSEHHL
jgi:cell division protein FtsB